LASLLLAATLQVTASTLAQAAALQKPLPPQPLSDALLALAEQFHVLLMSNGEFTQGVTSKGAPAGLSLDDTLRAILEGTDLTYELIDGRMVVIHSKREAALHKKPSEAGDGVAESAPQAPSSGAITPSKDQQDDRSSLEDPWNLVIVTGTHLLGQEPVGAHPTTLTREYMDKRAYVTAADAIRALPQNFGGGPSEDTWHLGQEETYNTSRGMGLNLRGLGAGSTLILLNGRRLAVGGGDGRFVDVSGIPLTAIEKIDVLPDGASAIYGADAVGGVVNFVLRRNYNGVDSQVRLGTSTLGAPNQFQAALTGGKTWATGSALVSFEGYHRSAVRAADRLQSRDSDLRTLGGDNFDILEGNPGTIVSSSGIWGIPQGQNGQGLKIADLNVGQPNLHNRNDGMDLLPDQRRGSIVGTLTQEIGKHVHLFADVLFSQRNTEVVLGPTKMTLTVPSTNPFYINPAAGTDPPVESDPTVSTDPVLVTYSFARDFGPEIDQSQVRTTSATLGVDWSIHRWLITPAVSFASYHDRVEGGPFVDQAALATALADSNRDTAFNPFGDGSFTNSETLKRLRLDAFLDRETKLRSVNIAANGTLAEWFDRKWPLALGAEMRWEEFDTVGLPSAVTTIDWHTSRSVKAAYAELLVPIIDKPHRLTGVESLHLSIASRYDDYSDFEGRPTPRFGLNWSPLQGVNVRGSWSESFKAPSLVERDTTRNFSLLTSLTNKSASLSQVLLWLGTNPDLHDEKATTWTLGTDIVWRGLSFELTYFNLKYRERVDRIDFSPTILIDPTLEAFVTENPSQEQKDEVCQRGHFLGDINYCLITPVDAIVDLRLANVALMTTAGVDVSLNYGMNSRFGRFEAGLNMTYIDKFSKARYSTSPLITYVDEPGYPLRFRSKADLLWERKAFSVTGVVNFSDSYTDSASKRFVHPWTTLDLGMRYRLGAGTHPTLGNVTIDLNTQNLFDKRPPFVNNANGVGYDPENADLLGRFISVGIRNEW
jgi:outer membrane receptor protein involved in Fe transport